MAKMISILLVMIFQYTLHLQSTAIPIGVNYGTVANNLPPPLTVARYLKSQTLIDKVKIFDYNPQIIQAFANTNISLTITIPNSLIIPLSTNLSTSQKWVKDNITPYVQKTVIRYIAVGNEVQLYGNMTQISSLPRAMDSINRALQLANLTQIKVISPHSLAILANSNPPSSGRFKPEIEPGFLVPLLDFHRRTRSPFMVNPYPYFGFNKDTLDFALFKQKTGNLDPSTGLRYFNMFDAMMDATYSAMKRLGYADVELAVGETGWPSKGGPNDPEAKIENAKSYNGNLVKHINSGRGTPLMPNRTFDTYIFALFNENLKNSLTERNYGLYYPNLTRVYDVGLLKTSG